MVRTRTLGFVSVLVVAAIAALAAGGGMAAAASPGRPSRANGAFAGYVTHWAAPSIRATFVVPTINCSRAPSPSNIEISIITSEGHFYRTGTGGVIAECNKGKASYVGFTSVDKRLVIDPVGITPGQKVTVTIRVEAEEGGRCKVTIESPGGTRSESGVGFSASYDAAVISLLPATAGMFPKFTALKFSRVTVGGKLLGSADAHGLSAEDAKGRVLAAPTTISHGTGFTVEDKA